MHKTSNLEDGYMGSGKLIKKAIQKYSIENFTKDILHIFDNEEDMKNKEKELVVINEMSYNLCDGGHGGFGYINSNPEKFLTEKRMNAHINVDKLKNFWSIKYKNDIKFRKECRERAIKAGLKAKELNPNGTFFGKKHTEETKQKMQKSKNVGKNNASYGTCWITNGKENKKIKKENLDEFIKLGYYKGRI
jgi:hypothetical protein